jgi:hypothetical protein
LPEIVVEAARMAPAFESVDMLLKEAEMVGDGGDIDNIGQFPPDRAEVMERVNRIKMETAEKDG